MSALIDKGELFNKLANVQTLGEAYAVIQEMPSAEPEITNEEIRFSLKQLRVYLAIKIRNGKEGGVPVELLKRVEEIQKYFENVSSAQPDVTDTNVGDCISRQAVRYKLTALVNEFEEILSHIREREVDDSVCGLCEYDGAYMGQSGDWCNECPGFEKDDCFKLKEKYREEWMKIDG